MSLSARSRGVGGGLRGTTYDDRVSDLRSTAAPLRRVRGAVVGLVGAAVAVAGHVLAGGAAVSPAVVVSLALVVAGTVVASSTRWTVPRLLVALAAAQPAVHGVLWLTGPAGASDPRLAAGGTAAHAAHGHEPPSLRMLLAHAAAVVVAAVLLAALERCALSLWTLLNAVRLVTSRVTVPAPVPLAVAAPAYAVRGTGLVVVGARPRRGPPALLAPR